MRILFLCGGLEPGRDGVGDYTRTLAAECARQGAQTHLIALNDEFIQTDAVSPEDPSLRLPAAAPWAARIRRAGAEAERFNPDWVSLQFVTYGFHPRGLPFGLTPRLLQLTAGRPTHIMFHELWIGEASASSGKERAIGLLQRRIIQHMLRGLQPAVIHTSNPLYQHLLGRIGIMSGELPLFGSIPIAPQVSPDFLYGQLRPHGLSIDAQNRTGYLLAGVFGTIHPQWDSRQFLDRFLEETAKTGRRPLLIAIGRSGDAGDRMMADLAGHYGTRLPCISLGDRSSGEVSQLFQALDLGVATSPWSLIGKSSATAAMLDHGLPVVVPRDDCRLRSGSGPEPAPHPLLLKADETFWVALRRGLPGRVPRLRVAEVAETMLRALSVGGRTSGECISELAAFPAADA